ncbi:related to tetratricopeptide repeat domain protein-Neosartorya fischeri [Serendipita indica DSM 11827]|uniref:Related to tetratricopeptide repeat domain protein-Neosartorya fischeri n=1 Tax=Serendipita indica (strain DSM 11827) TaxID=1109443 RepID=G4TXP6_SERID|nr:related to tetratricopeptide repeat domain protein-Neosartorya fischeri [Serendipita indica DSM 11827]
MANRSHTPQKNPQSRPQTARRPVKSTRNADRNSDKRPDPRSKVDDLGFLELSPGTDPIVDIVAIHGLDGHREKSWATKGSIMWLRDFLPTDLSNARVLSYGYDADTSSRECVSTQTMRRHADGFARALARRRKDHPRRPFIFVAHDLGGIILKWALVICHNQRLETKCDLRDLLTSTHAILFFGTPHSGTDTSLLEQVTRVASVYMETTDTIPKDLRVHSSELENIQSLYVQASTNIHTNVSYSSAVIAGDPNATAIVLHTDHRDLVRFAVQDQDNYQTVLHYLREYVDDAAVQVKEKWVKEDAHRGVSKGESIPEEVIMPKPRPPVSRGYIERIHFQSLITRKLLPDGPVKHQPRCILHGLGGAGKTQLATNWIQENESRFNRVIFVDATSEAQLEADLQHAVEHLGYKEKKWLLFIDNADSPDLDLRPYLPRSVDGAILITTRNRQCTKYAQDGAVPVGGREESEAINLLHTTADIAPASSADSLEIVKELGMLALAITQAGVYIRDTKRLSTYLDTFRKSRDRLLSKQLDLDSEYTSSTYTAFDLSFHRLQKTTQEFLKLCAFLHHSLIPLSLFERSITSGFTTHTVEKSCPPPASDKTFRSKLEEIFGKTWDEVSFQEIINAALRASLINVTTDGLFYAVHPLLQMYIQDSLVVEDKKNYIRMTAQLLLGAIRPAPGSNVELWQLLPHANSVPLSTQSENLAHTLVFNDFYDSLGNWNTCWKLLECSLAQVQRCQGERHIDTMLVMSRLGEALWCCGELGKAEKMQRDTHVLRLEVSGPRHPDTIPWSIW